MTARSRRARHQWKDCPRSVFSTDLRADVTPTRLQAAERYHPLPWRLGSRPIWNRWARKAKSGGMTYLWESEGARRRPRLKGLLGANPAC